MAKSKTKKDACYHKVKSRYTKWPSAYASGALVKCRKVGAKNWGNKSRQKKANGGFVTVRGQGAVMSNRLR